MAQQKNKSTKEKEEKKEETVKNVSSPTKTDKFNVEKFREPDVKKEVLDAQLKLKGSILKLKYLYIIGLVVLALIVITNKPVREKVVSLFESIKKGSAENEKDTAVFEWWKEPHQYGQKRNSGPTNAVITRNDENVFNFELTYFCKSTGEMEKSFFEGEKVSRNRIEGTWSQANPEDGGHWYLVQDIQNPRLFSGSHSDKTGDKIKCRLKIKLK